MHVHVGILYIQRLIICKRHKNWCKWCCRCVCACGVYNVLSYVYDLVEDICNYSTHINIGICTYI